MDSLPSVEGSPPLMLTVEQRERMLRNKQAAQERLESSRKKQRTGDAFSLKANPQTSVSFSEQTSSNARSPDIGGVSSEVAGAGLPVATLPNLSELWQSRTSQQAGPPLWVKEGARNVLGLLNGNAMASSTARHSSQTVRPTKPKDKASKSVQLPSLPSVSTPSSQGESKQQFQGASSSGISLTTPLQACTDQRLPPGTMQITSSCNEGPALHSAQGKPPALELQAEKTAQLEDSPEFDDDWLQEIDSLCEARRADLQPPDFGCQPRERLGQPVRTAGNEEGANIVSALPGDCLQEARPSMQAECVQSAKPQGLCEGARLGGAGSFPFKAVSNCLQVGVPTSSVAPGKLPGLASQLSNAAAATLTSGMTLSEKGVLCSGPSARPPPAYSASVSISANAEGPVSHQPSSPNNLTRNEGLSVEESVPTTKPANMDLLPASSGWRTVVRDRTHPSQTS